MEWLRLRKEDNLLSALYPLLLYCRFTGFLPVVFDRKNDVIKFSWFSIPILYTILFSLSTSYISSYNFPLQSFKLTFGGFFENITNVFLNLITSFSFEILHFSAYFIARRTPLYFKTLHDCIKSICVGSENEKIVNVMIFIKKYTVRSLSFYCFLTIVNLVLVTVESVNALQLIEYHPFMFTGFFLWQFLYASHVVCGILSTAFIHVLRCCFKEINDQFEILLGVPNRHQNVFTCHNNNNTVDKCRENSNEKHIVNTLELQMEPEFIESKDTFSSEFGRLKKAYMTLEQLVNQFFSSTFIFIEILLAVFTLLRIFTSFRGIWSFVNTLFQIFYHSFFVFRLLFTTNGLSKEAQSTVKIFLSSPFKDIPLECQTEVHIFTTKILAKQEPGIIVYGIRLSRVLDRLKFVIIILFIVSIFIGYVVYVVVHSNINMDFDWSFDNITFFDD